MRIQRLFVAALAVLLLSLAMLLGATVTAQKPKALQADLACFEPDLPRQLGRDVIEVSPKSEVGPSLPYNVSATYELLQNPVSFFSTPGSGPLVHGRQDVLANSELIRRLADKDLELIVAASIAHQASDIKDRPFGADAVETFWLENVNPDASVGIAQLRASEVVYWAPRLVGADLLDPEVAVRVMTAKLAKANHYITRTYPEASAADRYMLLALVQNDSSEIAMRRTIEAFFITAQSDWETLLSLEQAKSRGWSKQLRLMLVQLDWLVSEGWEKPAGLDRDRWAQIAFPSANQPSVPETPDVEPEIEAAKVATRQ